MFTAFVGLLGSGDACREPRHPWCHKYLAGPLPSIPQQKLNSVSERDLHEVASAEMAQGAKDSRMLVQV